MRVTRNEQNTVFPRSLESVIRQIDLAAEQGTDVHTVTIQLDNGRWRVELAATDAQMNDATGIFWLDRGGNLR